MAKSVFKKRKKGKPRFKEAADQRPIEYIYIKLSSICKLLIILAACFALTLIISGDLSLTVITPKPARPTAAPAPERTPRPTPRPTPEPQGVAEADLGWWTTHAAFGNFPAYNGMGNVEPAFKSGPLFSDNYQYKLSDVGYDDYIAYLELCAADGYVPYDPYKGFVEADEMNETAQDGYVEFVSGGYRLEIYYRSYANELIFHAGKAPDTTDEPGAQASLGVG